METLQQNTFQAIARRQLVLRILHARNFQRNETSGSKQQLVEFCLFHINLTSMIFTFLLDTIYKLFIIFFLFKSCFAKSNWVRCVVLFHSSRTKRIEGFFFEYAAGRNEINYYKKISSQCCSVAPSEAEFQLGRTAGKGVVLACLGKYLLLLFISCYFASPMPSEKYNE